MSDRGVFRTVDGQQVRIRPVAQLLVERIRQGTEKQVRAEGLTLDPPSYSATTAAGTVETYEHDAESIKTATEGEQAVWAAYLEGQRKLSQLVGERTQRLILGRGIEIKEVPAEWIADMREFGVELADDPAALRYDYILLEILKTPEDIYAAMGAISKLSMAGVGQEALDAVDSYFRSLLQGAAPEGSVPDGRPVDVQLGLSGNVGGAGEPQDAE